MTGAVTMSNFDSYRFNGLLRCGWKRTHKHTDRRHGLVCVNLVKKNYDWKQKNTREHNQSVKNHFKYIFLYNQDVKSMLQTSAKSPEWHYLLLRRCENQGSVLWRNSQFHCLQWVPELIVAGDAWCLSASGGTARCEDTVTTQLCVNVCKPWKLEKELEKACEASDIGWFIIFFISWAFLLRRWFGCLLAWLV